ncbi:MAG: bifunctional demethylmenaquinone methyltransferase/2-methoxy-6-polyprenyl-1,4-benzoquinol methylase UbiE [Peptococcaceae bacterium]|nr:bifunctional demethylmenaquinone methyltransferase/2-methoxy-6-polyprenyl-1,4-benzoquinol methylase UbiE [Peptococcaceae bacterium]
MKKLNSDKHTFVKETFNAIAGHYDGMNTLMSLGRDQHWRALAVEYVRAKPQDSVLDVCCGTGKLVLSLTQAVGEHGQVTGVDFSEKMLSIAQQRLHPLIENGQVSLLQGDALDLPFADRSFDGVTIGWGLRNLPDLHLGLQELIRVVEPGGWVVSLDMAKPDFPVFKQAYWFYFERWIPFMGAIWGKKRSAYQYLHDSARDFPSQQVLAQMFAEHGLKETGYKNLMGGAIALVFGCKGTD